MQLKAEFEEKIGTVVWQKREVRFETAEELAEFVSNPPQNTRDMEMWGKIEPEDLEAILANNDEEVEPDGKGTNDKEGQTSAGASQEPKANQNDGSNEVQTAKVEENIQSGEVATKTTNNNRRNNNRRG